MDTQNSIDEPFGQLSAAQWAAAGVGHIAYLKPVEIDGAQAVAVHAADGTPLLTAPDAITARAAIRSHDLEAASVH